MTQARPPQRAGAGVESAPLDAMTEILSPLDPELSTGRAGKPMHQRVTCVAAPPSYCLARPRFG